MQHIGYYTPVAIFLIVTVIRASAEDTDDEPRPSRIVIDYVSLVEQASGIRWLANHPDTSHEMERQLAAGFKAMLPALEKARNELRSRLNNEEIDQVAKAIASRRKKLIDMRLSAMREALNASIPSYRDVCKRTAKQHASVLEEMKADLVTLGKLRPKWRKEDVVHIIASSGPLGADVVTGFPDSVRIEPMDNGEPEYDPVKKVVRLLRDQTSRQAAPLAAHEMYHAFEHIGLGRAYNLEGEMRAQKIGYHVFEQIGKPEGAFLKIQLSGYQLFKNDLEKWEHQVSALWEAAKRP